ncbi:MAG: hypothetical protein Q8N53_12660 [Longimicrobiales bacterium]|nr:hypothetical protein [Longimicrobiales bacterium]
MGTLKMALLALLTLGFGAQDATVDERLYGRVVTAGGRVYEGFLRWDKNEGSWADLLDGSKEIPWENREEAERLGQEGGRRGRDREIQFLGLRISWTEGGEDDPSTAASGIRFGHVRSIAVLGDERALLTLKSGEEIELEGGSTDLGDGLRGLVVEDSERGAVELRWSDLDRVEFMAPPEDAAAPEARRLHGTVRTRDGHEFTGYVAWDTDEILTSDVLDGEERGRDREIAFEDIAAIERASASSARVVLVGGEEIVLRGSNDVDESIRGIAVSDPGLGQVTVSWDEFEEVAFDEAPEGAGYDGFDGGHPLWGVVEDEGGERLEGYIRWDNDEAWSWEILDGRTGEVQLDVEFGQISSIRRLRSGGAEVTLMDGRTFDMDGSNDVDDGNKGIFVTLADGETALVRWSDLREVTFQAR